MHLLEYERESLSDWKNERRDGKEGERKRENEGGERIGKKTGTWREWREFIITSKGQQGFLYSDALFKSERTLLDAHSSVAAL